MKHQHLIALQSANKVRLARSRLHQEIRTLTPEEGRALVADILKAPPDFMLTALVVDVLTWPLRMGTVRAQTVMRICCVGVSRRVGEATERQRLDLGRCLRGLESLVAADEEERVMNALAQAQERAA